MSGSGSGNSLLIKGKSDDSSAWYSSQGGHRPAVVRFGEIYVLEDSATTSTYTIRVLGRKEPKKVARYSLFCLGIHNPFRRVCLQLVESKWCDRIILLCIAVNSIILAIEKHRAPPTDLTNETINAIGNVLSSIFLAECVLKNISWGCRVYISDSWNILDFVVVVSAVIEWIPFIPFGGLSFLRLFRVLRPLRSLNSVPEMKVLVNTTVGAVPRLSNVAALGGFIFLVFSIIGVTLMPGIFYRECHVNEKPELVVADATTGSFCWEWLKVGDGNLCGGEYDCTMAEDGVTTRLGWCGGHEFDGQGFAPVFESELDEKGPLRGGFPWCSDESRPTKVAPELDFVHFDHLPGAFLLIFQCMTMEGWTDMLYYVKDSFSFWFAVLYFFMLIVVTSHFLLNVALAVVDEVRDDFDNDQTREADALQLHPEDNNGGGGGGGSSSGRASLLRSSKGGRGGGGGGGGGGGFIGSEGTQAEEEIIEDNLPTLWSNSTVVHFCQWVTSTHPWQNFILLIITANVITMMLAKFPPDVVLDDLLEYVNRTFLAIFVVEMMVEIVSRGPIGYWKNASTAFDGFVVVVSLIETALLVAQGDSSGSALQALRTLRLFRVLNKFASRNPRIAILLKSMVGTAKALRYWLVLFFLVLYICTLMWMHFFANTLQFEDPDALAVYVGRYETENGEETLVPWCELKLDTPLARQRTSWHYKQDCIPRAHFDNFGWGFVTVFQIMTGENWNAIMYAGMRATRHNNWEWAFGILFVMLLLFGQILFLSLFLSMLLSKFDEFRERMSEEAARRKERMLHKRARSMEGDALDGNRWAKFSSRTTLSLSLASQAPSTRVITHVKDVWKRSRWHRPRPEVPEDFVKSGPSEESVASAALKRARQLPRSPWPHGWSWFLMPPDFPLRVVANDILNRQVILRGVKVNAFETIILACILLSTLCMMIDFPLANPQNPVISTVRTLDEIFSGVFIAEMVIKLLAWPVFWGEGAYLWSEGCAWNWLDFIVVAVSVMGFVGGGPSGLKTLRILRAFRPLRVVKRLETLRNIVEAIFSSLKELGVLLIVFLLFLLIFALVFMMYLNGTLYACSDSDVWFYRDLHDPDYESVTLPLCLSAGAVASLKVVGSFSESALAWNASTGVCGEGDLAGFSINWARASPDTPICVARCDPFWREPFNSTYAAPAELCPRPYQTVEELPHTCSEKAAARPGRLTYSEEIGFLYIEKMQAQYVLPCGGSTAESFIGTDASETGEGWGEGLEEGSLDSSWAEAVGTPSERMSCRAQFCPNVNPDRTARCKYESESHPYFCADACRGGKASTGKCKSCRAEYVASCECPDFCTPLMKDAALCAEQGGSWEQVLSQNFDNVFNAMLALVEISTTEGWVDVMYAACDTSFAPYIQPLRDQNHAIWIVMFVLWILLSFMFLLNLGVGIIVDKFMEMRNQGKGTISPAQLRWIKSRMSLTTRPFIFNLENLHRLPLWRRKVYDIVEHSLFERTIMICIVLNTLLMACVCFPELETPDFEWWNSLMSVTNYTFAFVFAVEAILKLLALQQSYWKDSWNVFDFICVLATVIGIVLTASESGVNISSVASVVRIFRIARLFRLLKFKALRPLNKLFRSLAISLVKLANVGVVAVLFLILFSILGVNVFSTVSIDSETYNQHANFRHFINAFITLFRASTGEAWNEIMHDLHKDEADWFRAGSWCTPSALFDTETGYDILKEKCLIDNPNACVVDIFKGWVPLPWVYWVTYSLFMGLVIMNVVIAVILEGYEETKSSDEVTIIETCRTLWGDKYDPDHKMVVTFPQACRFIVEAINELQKDGSISGEKISIKVFPARTPNSSTGVDLSRFPLRFARALDITPRTFVTFEEATKQVVRFAAVVENPVIKNPVEEASKLMEDLDNCDQQVRTKEMQRLKLLEALKKPPTQVPGSPLFQHIAAMVVQRMAREALEKFRKKRQRYRMSTEVDDNDETAKAEIAQQHLLYMKCVARAVELGTRTGLAPPVAG